MGICSPSSMGVDVNPGKSEGNGDLHSLETTGHGKIFRDYYYLFYGNHLLRCETLIRLIDLIFKLIFFLKGKKFGANSHPDGTADKKNGGPCGLFMVGTEQTRRVSRRVIDERKHRIIN